MGGCLLPGEAGEEGVGGCRLVRGPEGEGEVGAVVRLRMGEVVREGRLMKAMAGEEGERVVRRR